MFPLIKANKTIKKTILISLLLAIVTIAIAENNEVEEPIILTEIVVNPDGTHNDPHRSGATLVVYQNDNTFYFGESFSGCLVTLLSTNLVVYNDIVDSDGIVIIPESFSGAFELCITVGSQVFSAEIIL